MNFNKNIRKVWTIETKWKACTYKSLISLLLIALEQQTWCHITAIFLTLILYQVKKTKINTIEIWAIL